VLYGGSPLSNPDAPRAAAVASAASLTGYLTVISGWVIVIPLVILTVGSNRLQVWLGLAGALLGVLLAAALGASGLESGDPP